MEEKKEFQKYITLCNSYIRTEKIFKLVTIIVAVASFLGGLTGVIISSVTNDFSKLSLFCIMMVVVPLLLYFCYLIWLFTASGRKYNQLILGLRESKLSAEEILHLGKETGLDLFSVALEIRCIKELKMKSIPEWCVRDGVLPEKYN